MMYCTENKWTNCWQEQLEASKEKCTARSTHDSLLPQIKHVTCEANDWIRGGTVQRSRLRCLLQRPKRQGIKAGFFRA
eukprot:6184958-Pleurochrysis_carterae.AAC.6